MNDEKLIRLENLKALKRDAKALSAAVGGRYTYWRDMLAGDKSFGEKIARKIEDKLVLPHGWMDKVHTVAEASEQEPVRKGQSYTLSNDEIARAITFLVDTMSKQDSTTRNTFAVLMTELAKDPDRDNVQRVKRVLEVLLPRDEPAPAARKAIRAKQPRRAA